MIVEKIPDTSARIPIDICVDMIFCSAQIRKAWDDRKTVQQNLRDMGLQHDPKGVLPIRHSQVRTVSVLRTQSQATL